MTEARNDIFWWIRFAVTPGVSIGTTKPRIPSSVCAHTTATSATLPLVIHILEPFSSQSSPSRLALVRMPEGLDPKSASVSPKHPSASPVANRGSHCCFCSSEPKAWIAYMASDPVTLTSDRMPESPASSSRQAKP